MSNYNKVKNEGVEEALNKFLDSKCYEIGNPETKGLMRSIYPNHEGTWGIHKESLKSYLSTFAEKVHKATLEDVLEFVGEDEKVSSKSDFSKGIEIGTINLSQRIRDYIKTLIK